MTVDKSGWNNRIIKRHDPAIAEKDPEFATWYQIHEVFYDEDGKVEGWAEEAEAPFGHSIEELRRSYDLMVEAFGFPVLEEVGEEVHEIAE